MARTNTTSAVERASAEIGRLPRSTIRSWKQRTIEAGYWMIDGPGAIHREMSLSTKQFCEISLVLTDLDDMTLSSGESLVRTGPVQKGRFRVSPADTTLSASVSASSTVRFLKVFFTELTARAIRAELRGHAISIELEDPMLGVDDVLLAALAEDIVETLTDPRPANHAFAEEAAILMAGRAITHYSTARHFRTLSATSRGLDPDLDKAIQLMQDHIGSPVDLEVLSKSVGLSVFSFIRSFKRKYGSSPIRYHRMMRLDRAKLLLSTTSYSVARISVLLGFSEPSHFVSSFRKTTGLTPFAYRRAPFQSG